MKVPLFFLLLGAIAGSMPSTSFADQPLTRREVPIGSPLNLQEFGAENVGIAVIQKEISTITVQIVDYTKQVVSGSVGAGAAGFAGGAVTVATGRIASGPQKIVKTVKRRTGSAPKAERLRHF
ncbi:hypothetical protein ACXR0O_24970 [Verrucomicrobiota bacterium sgz303538]